MVYSVRSVRATMREAQQAFRKEIEGWNVEDGVRGSPKLDDELKDTLVASFDRLTGHFFKNNTLLRKGRAGQMRYSLREAATGAAILDDILDCAQIRDLDPPEAKFAAEHLFASVRDRARNVIDTLGINATSYRRFEDIVTHGDVLHSRRHASLDR